MSRRSKSDPKIEWLRGQPWWGDLPEQDLGVLAANGDRATVPAGSTIMREGELGRESAVIVRGEVEILHEGEILATLGPGDVVGELSVLDRMPRNADVRTATDVDLLVFSLRGLQHAMADSEHVLAQVRDAAARHRGGSDAPQ